MVEDTQYTAHGVVLPPKSLILERNSLFYHAIFFFKKKMRSYTFGHRVMSETVDVYKLGRSILFPLVPICLDLKLCMNNITSV